MLLKYLILNYSSFEFWDNSQFWHFFIELGLYIGIPRGQRFEIQGNLRNLSDAINEQKALCNKTLKYGRKFLQGKKEKL